MKCVTRLLFVVQSLVFSLSCFATASEEVLTSIESRAQQLTDLSDRIWDLAEVGYQEVNRFKRPHMGSGRGGLSRNTVE